MGQSTRSVKTDIKQQTFRVANFPSEVRPRLIVLSIYPITLYNRFISASLGSRHFVDNAQTVVKVSGRVRVAKNISFINSDVYQITAFL